jgi:chromosome partitioning protein
MGRIIVFANQKGGVTKTTMTWLVSAGLKQRGYKVLVVDFEPQGDLSDSAKAENEKYVTSYDLIKGDASAEECVQHLEVFDIIPANQLLYKTEKELIGEMGAEHRLKEALEPIKGQYDFILVDTPPTLGILTFNAFTAADEIIIPTTAGKYSVKAIKEIHQSIQKNKKYCGGNGYIRGLIFTRVKSNTNANKLMQTVGTNICEQLQIPVFRTTIREATAIEDAQIEQQDIFSLKENKDLIADYNAFIDEILEEGK